MANAHFLGHDFEEDLSLTLARTTLGGSATSSSQYGHSSTLSLTTNPARTPGISTTSSFGNPGSLSFDGFDSFDYSLNTTSSLFPPGSSRIGAGTPGLLSFQPGPFSLPETSELDKKLNSLYSDPFSHSGSETFGLGASSSLTSSFPLDAFEERYRTKLPLPETDPLCPVSSLTEIAPPPPPPSFIPPSWAGEVAYNNLNLHRDPLEPPHSFSPSFTNPNNSNSNCASVSAARINGYNTADDMYQALRGCKPPRGGLTFDQIRDLLGKTGRRYQEYAYKTTPWLTAYQALQQCPPPEQKAAYLTGYLRGGSQSGHAVVSYKGVWPGLTFVDYQHSNFGEPLPPGDIESAVEIRLFHLTDNNGMADSAVAIRNMSRCMVDKQSVADWTTGPRVPGGPFPGFYALQDHVKFGKPPGWEEELKKKKKKGKKILY